MSGPAFQVTSQPGGHVSLFEDRWLPFSLRPCEKQQPLDSLMHLNRLLAKQRECAVVFVGRPRSTQSHVDLSLKHRQRRSQLVSSVSREPLLPFERTLKVVEQRVERPGQIGKFVLLVGHRQPQAEVGGGYGRAR